MIVFFGNVFNPMSWLLKEHAHWGKKNWGLRVRRRLDDGDLRNGRGVLSLTSLPAEGIRVGPTVTFIPVDLLGGLCHVAFTLPVTMMIVPDDRNLPTAGRESL
jgi:hypothetical protein